MRCAWTLELHERLSWLSQYQKEERLLSINRDVLQERLFRSFSLDNFPAEKKSFLQHWNLSWVSWFNLSRFFSFCLSYWEPNGCHSLTMWRAVALCLCGGEEGWWERESVWKGLSRKPEQCFCQWQVLPAGCSEGNCSAKSFFLWKKLSFFSSLFISWFRTFKNSFFFSSGMKLCFLASSNPVFSHLGMYSSKLTLKNGISFKWRLLPISE